MSTDSVKLGGKTLERGDLVTVFGGTGFLGRYVVASLASKGYRVRVAVRNTNMAHDLGPMGDPGQIHPVQVNIRHKKSCQAALQGASAVINLIGILSESGVQTFDGVHGVGPARLAALAAEQGITNFIHVSAIGADEESTSAYGRSKALGEKGVLKALPTATIVRPSIVFGPEDDFFNRFADMSRLSPALPLIGGGQTKFQPVYVKDVADALATLVESQGAQGAVYELGGPEVETFEELLKLMLEIIERSRVLVPIPFGIATLIAKSTQFLPGAPITVDQIEMLKSDNVVSQTAQAEGRTLEGLGIKAKAPDVVLPTYLVRFRKTGEFPEPEIV